MELAALVREGWERHDTEAAGLADDLEANTALVTNAEGANHFLRLANHTIGEHLQDWPRARRLAEQIANAVDPVGPESLGYLAIAQTLAGDAVASALSEARAIAASSTAPLTTFATHRVLLVAALASAGRVEDAATLYTAALAIANELPDARDPTQPLARSLAVTSNNLASDLLIVADRTAAATDLMQRAAEAAREYWEVAGNWLNVERAESLLATVATDVGDFEKALDHTHTALELIHTNDEPQPVDEAFLELTAARALYGQSKVDAADAALARADELAANFDSPGLVDWYQADRERFIV